MFDHANVRVAEHAVGTGDAACPHERIVTSVRAKTHGFSVGKAAAAILGGAFSPTIGHLTVFDDAWCRVDTKGVIVAGCRPRQRLADERDSGTISYCLCSGENALAVFTGAIAPVAVRRCGEAGRAKRHRADAAQ